MAVALTLEYLFLWFLLYAFIGWVYESVLVSVSERRWVNRGFLNGPLCPIYGCGAVLAIVLLHDFTNPIEIFLISSFGASILEYITSWGMEKLFHARWWDYSHYRFNIVTGTAPYSGDPDGGITAITDSTSKAASVCSAQSYSDSAEY